MILKPKSFAVRFATLSTKINSRLQFGFNLAMPRKKRFLGKSSDAHSTQAPKGGAHSASTSKSDTHATQASKGGAHSASTSKSDTHAAQASKGGAHSAQTSRSAHSMSHAPSGSSFTHPEVDSLYESEDNNLPTFGDTSSNSSSRKSDGKWIVEVIDEDETTKEAHLAVKDVWELDQGRKIIVRCNDVGQAIGNAGGLLGGFIGQVGCNFSYFPICYVSWRKMPTEYKNNVYSSIIEKYFHIVNPRAQDIVKMHMGKIWKEGRNSLFHEFYNPNMTFEENVTNHPVGIDINHWRWFLEHRTSAKAQAISEINTANRQKQAYTHTNGSKSIARRKDEEEKKRGSQISRGEMWTMVHKKKSGSYMHEDAKAIGEQIMNIEREDESSKILSKNDSLAQVLGNEHSGRVRGMGFGPCPTQVFGHTSRSNNVSSNASVERAIQEVNQMKSQLEAERNQMNSKLEVERLERQNLQATVEAERLKRQSLEQAVKYMLQMQASNLPPDLAAMVASMAPDDGSEASHDAQHNRSNQSEK